MFKDIICKQVHCCAMGSPVVTNLCMEEMETAINSSSEHGTINLCYKFKLYLLNTFFCDSV